MKQRLVECRNRARERESERVWVGEKRGEERRGEESERRRYRRTLEQRGSGLRMVERADRGGPRGAATKWTSLVGG